MLDWDDLHTFLAIARHGSLSAAARALAVQQTTIGRRLAALESRAGARLLQKTPRGYTLTPAGEAILGNVERIESETLAIERRITGRDVRLEGTVRLTAVESLAADILLPALPELRRRHPGIHIDLIAETRSLSLTMREADIALRLARPRQHDLAIRRVGGIGFALYAAPAYLDAHGQPDLAAGSPGHAAILFETDQAHLDEVAWFAGLTANAVPVLRSNSRYCHRAAARAGIGLACLARYLGDGHGLARLPTPTPGPSRDLYLCVHNDIRHTPRIRAVTDFLAEALRAESGRLNPAD
jgi:DNA-binding transcriptional LysR family regulator